MIDHTKKVSWKHMSLGEVIENVKAGHLPIMI